MIPAQTRVVTQVIPAQIRVVTQVIPAQTRVVTQVIPAQTRVVTQVIPAQTRVVTQVIPAQTRVVTQVIPAQTQLANLVTKFQKGTPTSFQARALAACTNRANGTRTRFHSSTTRLTTTRTVVYHKSPANVPRMQGMGQTDIRRGWGNDVQGRKHARTRALHTARHGLWMSAREQNRVLLAPASSTFRMRYLILASVAMKHGTQRSRLSTQANTMGMMTALPVDADGNVS